MQSIQVNTRPAIVCVGNDNHSTIEIFQPEFVWPPIQQSINGRDSTLPPKFDEYSIKCCNECDSCKTPIPRVGYSVNKLSTPYYASMNPSLPSMASLLAKAWKVKAMAMKRKGLTSLATPSLKKAAAALQPVKRKVVQEHCICPLLSRRLGKNMILTVEIPSRKPFPPPLVWKPQSSPPQPVKRKVQEHGIHSPLLSRRLGKNVFLTVVIPNRNPFPPPLVWKPQSNPPQSIIFSPVTPALDHQSTHTYTCL